MVDVRIPVSDVMSQTLCTRMESWRDKTFQRTILVVGVGPLSTFHSFSAGLVLIAHIILFTFSELLVPLSAVQCDQTTIWATPRIRCREEVGQSFQGRVRFLLRVRLQHGNYLDCSSGAFSARRRRLGIFALAALT